MLTTTIKEEFKKGNLNELILDIYADESKTDYQVSRYIKAIEEYEKIYGVKDVQICSAPGRSEICGNHTDHQHGEILAAAINLDAMAVVAKTDDGICRITSEGYGETVVDTADLKYSLDEEGTSKALIKGVISRLKDLGYEAGGFTAYVTSDVTNGAGLSSSAAFETLIGTIISFEYNDGKLDSVTNATIGQYAENVYFGKPCGLMDQMACSVGSMVHVDFNLPMEKAIEKKELDLNKYGYSLCITDTKGSHANLTPEYAAIPVEMRSIAEYFQKGYLVDVTKEDVMSNITALREKCGDRAVLRALHFLNENERVRRAVKNIEDNNMEGFLEAIKESGNSSYKFLQNVYCSSDLNHQNVSLALAVSEDVLAGGKGVCRVHGGGFAGTIQAFVKNESVAEYRKAMNDLFGDGSCNVLKIRKYGGMRVVE